MEQLSISYLCKILWVINVSVVDLIVEGDEEAVVSARSGGSVGRYRRHEVV